MSSKIICLLIPSLQAGGMQRVMSELAFYFCQKEFLNVHLILYGKDPEVFYNLPENIIIHEPGFKFSDRFRQIATIRRIIYLRHIVTTINPDKILSFGEIWNSFVLLALFKLPYHVFISDRCSPEFKFGSLHKLLRRILYRRAKGIIVQTGKAKVLFSQQYKNDNIAVIGNPVRKIMNQEQFVGRENIILSVGRLINTKHHDRLINIFSKLNAPDWTLIIVGGNDLKQNNYERLQGLVAEKCINNKVILAGEKSDVEKYYLKSKIFAFTSSSEGFPNVIGEALSAGLPVVSYDCVAGPSELIIQGRNGFIVPLFDDEQFQQKLQLLIDDENLRNALANNAVESIHDLSIENIGQKYLEYIL